MEVYADIEEGRDRIIVFGFNNKIGIERDRVQVWHGTVTELVDKLAPNRADVSWALAPEVE